MKWHVFHPCLCLILMFWGSTAFAKANLWERAKVNTQKFDLYDSIHAEAMLRIVEAEKVETKLRGEDQDERGCEQLRMQPNFKLNEALFLLKSVNAAHSNDGRLRIDLGRVLVTLCRYEEAIPVLSSGLALTPNYPRSEEMWFSLAISYSHRLRRDEEEKAYLRALEGVEDFGFRANILSNLAESQMALGKLSAALEHAEESVALAPGSIYARWTLAIIRDRSGDLWGALEAAKWSIQVSNAVHANKNNPAFYDLDRPGVFFVPRYEKFWYYGLGMWAQAELYAADVQMRARFLQLAIQYFETFARQATKSDRFYDRAREHVATLKNTLSPLDASRKPTK